MEVVAREGGPGSWRYLLEPWRETEAMRTVFVLDAAAVASAVVGADREAVDRRRLLAARVLAPVLGLAPARLQLAWQRSWGFAAGRATAASAVAEIVVGAVGLLQAFAVGFTSEWFLPPLLRWLAVVGPVLFGEGLLRLRLVSADGEPVGSILGLPLALLRTPPAAAGPAVVPEVRGWDPLTRTLELYSPILRRDWEAPGILPYRDEELRLDSVRPEGRGWRYLFRAATRSDGTRRLRLAPPPAAPVMAPAREGNSVLSTTLITAAMFFGRADHQVRWARRLGVRAVILTAVGAGAELVGGWVNLGRGAPGTGWLLIDLFFLVEGAGRLLLAAVTAAPVGSLLALPFASLYTRALEGAERSRPAPGSSDRSW